MIRNDNRLLRLIRDNLDRTRKFEVRAETGAEEATIYLYDAIDPYWGIPASEFVKALAAIQAPTIHLRINSPGGDVFEARAIATAVQEHPSNIISHIDGLAASAASYVAIAADEVEMTDGAFIMIHQAWAVAFGNSDDMMQMADLLDKVDESIANDYRKKTKKEKAQIQEWMKAETWFNAEEAKAEGFIDRIAGAQEDAATQASASPRLWNLDAFRNAPKKLKEPPAPAPQTFDRATFERRLALYERIAA